MDRACKDWRLSAYLDGELGADEAAQVERHLAGCAECRARLGALERIAGIMRQVRHSAPPPAASVHASLVRPVGGRRVSTWRWAVTCALAAAVSLGVRAWVLRPAAAAAPGRAANVRATVDFRSNQVVTVVSWSRERGPAR